jgi:transposase
MVAYNRLHDTQIAALRFAGGFDISNRAIAAQLGVSERTVRYWRAKEGPRDPKTPPQATPRALKRVKARRANLCALAQKVVTVRHRTRKEHSGSGSLKAALLRDYGLDVSKTTIKRDLKACGFSYRARKRSTHRTPADLAKRKAFAKLYKGKPSDGWVFTDEKTYTCADHTARREWSRSVNDLTCADNSTVDQDTVYVWGAIGINFRHLVVLRKTSQAKHATRKRNKEERPDNERFTSRTYIDRCLAGKVQRHVCDNNLVLQADNHRSHYSGEAKKCFTSKDMKYTTNWPARSPDLNPIENLWAHVQQEVSKRVPSNAEELAKYIVEEWDKLDDAFVNKYVRSFKGKCQRVWDRNGLPADGRF